MPSFQAICDAVAADFVAIASIARIQSYNQLTEGMNTLPTVQIYPESWNVSALSETDRLSFVDAITGQPKRITEVLIRVDVYVRQRSQLNEDWGQAVIIANDIQDQLETQGNCPMFGLAGLRSFQWRCQRVVFNYAEVQYTGWRYELTFLVY